ncbi:regulator of chromosome condensation repeat-containing protein [Babesia caballi]|uniref:Regulator of chromosome condensation repeat-containing protein n=1 Tax=Babesia caballi TaxID=5871 RepID=A0AAV4M1B7_BABCB|nr:regulator of chromosome condensation repeat-containing protein [Babesia caballi]
MYIWGQTEDGRFVQPFPLGTSGVVDCRCSATDIYMLTSDGAVSVIRDVQRALRDCGAASAGSPDGSDDDSPKDSFNDGRTNTFRTSTNCHPGVARSSAPPVERIRGLFGKRVVKMSVGNAHAAFLADDGTLYCTGDNSFGQCGLKPSNVTSDNTLVTFPRRDHATAPDHVDLHQVQFKDPATRVVDVACGGRHTCCLDSDGNIYTFGDDASVQLFLGDTRGRTLLELDQYKAFASRQERGTVSYTKYTHTDRHLQFNPIPVSRIGKLSEYQHLLCGADISLAAGDDFTIVAATPAGQGDRTTHLIASGGNRFGQCASVDVRMHRPRTVQLAGPLETGLFTCGSSHCVAALKAGGLVGWGSNQQYQLDPDSTLRLLVTNKDQSGGT